MGDIQGVENVWNSQLLRIGTRLLTGATLVSSVLAASLVCAIAFISALLNTTTMVVTGGSMEPAISPGDAVVMKPGASASIREGDVIIFRALGGGATNSHRVVAIKKIEGHAYFQTKGDANPTPDSNLTPAEAVQGKVIFTVPKAGYVLRFIGSTRGLLLIIAVPLSILLAQEVRGLRKGQDLPQPDKI